MEVAAAEQALREAMRGEGVDPDHLTSEAAWRVFRKFAAEPVATESNGVLVQSGVYDWDDGERFVFDFLRQVQPPGDDEYLQIHCEFQYEPTPALRALGTFEKWWFEEDATPLTAYLDRMHARPEFQAVEGLTPIVAKVYAEET